MLLQVAVAGAPAVYLYMRLNSTQASTAAWLQLWLHTHIPPGSIQLTRPTPEGQKPTGAAPQDAGLQELVCEPPASFITNTPQDSSLGVWYICFLQNLYLHNDPA